MVGTFFQDLLLQSFIQILNLAGTSQRSGWWTCPGTACVFCQSDLDQHYLSGCRAVSGVGSDGPFAGMAGFPYRFPAWYFTFTIYRKRFDFTACVPDSFSGTTGDRNRFAAVDCDRVDSSGQWLFPIFCEFMVAHAR